jgi:hypothetical protein
VPVREVIWYRDSDGKLRRVERHDAWREHRDDQLRGDHGEAKADDARHQSMRLDPVDNRESLKVRVRRRHQRRVRHFDPQVLFLRKLRQPILLRIELLTAERLQAAGGVTLRRLCHLVRVSKPAI